MQRDLARLSLVKNTTEDFLVRTGLPDDEVYRIVIAVYEAASNVVEHAYGDDSEGEFELALSLADGTMEIQLRDWGKSFDLSSVGEIDWDDYLASGKKRGLGIHLMRQVMDEVEYVPKGGGADFNLLRMRRTIAPNAPQSGQ